VFVIKYEKRFKETTKKALENSRASSFRTKCGD